MISDEFYRALEDRFRGTREDIKSRQKVYLPLIDTLRKRSDKPGLDVGCGRAEWLELLAEHGMPAVGVDTNSDFVTLGAGLGLSITNSDVSDFLAKQCDGIYGFVSAFHVVEHLVFDVLLSFLKSAHRVLDDQGFILLETPNPSNLTVGSNTFYMDPTHERPLPPGLLALAVEFAGFVSPIIVPMNRRLLSNPLQVLQEGVVGSATVNRIVDMLNHTLMSAPDYAVIAFKKSDEDYVSVARSLIVEPSLPVSDEKPVDVAAMEFQVMQTRAAADNALALANQMNAELAEISKRTMHFEHEAMELSTRVMQRDAELREMRRSLSWRMTRPLRATGRYLPRASSVSAALRRTLRLFLSHAAHYLTTRPRLKRGLSRLLAPFPGLHSRLSNLSQSATGLGLNADLGTLVVERADRLGQTARAVYADLLRVKEAEEASDPTKRAP